MSDPTPGPWLVLPEEVDRSYIRIRGTVAGSRYKVANVLHSASPGEREAMETRSNARLIASAPDLLAERNALGAQSTRYRHALEAIVDMGAGAPFDLRDQGMAAVAAAALKGGA